MKAKTKTKIVKYCKKLEYGDRTSPTVVLGLVLSQDNNFLVFRTGKHKIHVNLADVISLEETNIIFRENNGGGDYNDRDN